MVILLRWPFGAGSNVVHLVVDCIPQVFLLSISKFIFLVDKHCRLNVHLECQRVTNMSKEDIDWAFDLTKHNMQLL